MTGDPDTTRGTTTMSTQSEPAIWQRTTGWGEALQLEVLHSPVSPGLNPIVKVANAVAGDLGVRNTYAKLYDYAEPPKRDQDPRDCFRAWLVLTALGQNPAAWGVSDEAVPSGYDLNKLREQVTAASGWLNQIPALAA